MTMNMEEYEEYLRTMMANTPQPATKTSKRARVVPKKKLTTKTFTTKKKR